MEKKDSFFLGKVPSSAAEEAFAFHRGIAASDSHIWPRKEPEIHQLAKDGQLFGARSDLPSGKLVALCYVALSSDEKEFEIGGLTVDPRFQKLGLGAFLARLALAHTMAYERPWHNNQQLIAHVHEENIAPRTLLEHLGFEYIGRVEVAGTDAPASMKRNPAGNLVGDKFRFTPDGLRRLSNWFDHDFNGVLPHGANVTIDLGPAKLDDLREALRDLAR